MLIVPCIGLSHVIKRDQRDRKCARARQRPRREWNRVLQGQLRPCAKRGALLLGATFKCRSAPRRRLCLIFITTKIEY